METSKKVAEKGRVLKPATERVQHRVLEQEQQSAYQQRVNNHSIDGLPSGRGTRTLRQVAVIQMQRTHGNAHVMRQLQPSIQRQEEEGGAAATAGPSSISGSGGSVETGGGGVEITGGSIKMHSGMVEADGVVKASTIIADSVVASSYTPGAGNIW